MRATSRLFATVKPVRSAVLEVGAPTGLTGLKTHRAPRSTLIYLYSATLDKLHRLPESSVYRQSTENLTRHRLKLIEATKPEGLDDWQARLHKQVEERKGLFEQFGTDYRGSVENTSVAQKDAPTSELSSGGKGGDELTRTRVGKRERWNGRDFVVKPVRPERNELTEEWDGEEVTDEPEGLRTWEERKEQWAGHDGDPLHDQMELLNEDFEFEPEPRLSVEQIAHIESQIGAGLLEEVIQVAEGELQLVEKMADTQIWEELEEKPPEGQWKYHERNIHTTTQQP